MTTVFLYGDGIFEGIRIYDGNIFKCKEHLDRLYDSAKSIMLDIPLGYREMQEVLCETIRRNGLRDGYIRLVVSRGPVILALIRAVRRRRMSSSLLSSWPSIRRKLTRMAWYRFRYPSAAIFRMP